MLLCLGPSATTAAAAAAATAAVAAVGVGFAQDTPLVHAFLMLVVCVAKERDVAQQQASVATHAMGESRRKLFEERIEMEACCNSQRAKIAAQEADIDEHKAEIAKLKRKLGQLVKCTH